LVLLAQASVISAGAVAFAPQTPMPQAQARVAFVPADKVDINTASLDELLRIPGLPRTWAVRIIRYRPYRAKNDIFDRGVVTSDIYLRIKDNIVAHRAKP
jgi:DNA uptake protein ComE-like DNA-binding protein